MARGGFLGRIVNRIREVILPPSPPREPPREEPPEEPRDVSRREYRNQWREDRGKGNFGKNLAVFEKMMDDVGIDQDERLELWDSFIRNIVNGQGHKRRNSTDNLFWRDSGIDPADMNWQKWREAMGYTGKRRRNT